MSEYFTRKQAREIRKKTLKRNKAIQFILYSYLMAITICLFALIIFFPMLILTIIIYEFTNDPFNVLQILNLFTGVILLPFAQIIWLLIIFSVFDNEQPFFKAFQHHVRELIRMVEKGIKPLRG